MGRPKKEMAIAVKAYELFKRYSSVQKVADELHVSPQTVRNWRDGLFKEWDLDPAAFQAVKAQGTSSVLGSCQDQEIELLQSMLSTIGNVIKDGEVKPKKWPEVLDTVKFILDRLSRMMPENSKTLKTGDIGEMQDLLGTMAQALDAGGKDAQELLKNYKEPEKPSSKEEIIN